MAEVVGGRYELGAPLGRGGMARVVAARDLRLERDVAVKLVPIDDTGERVDPVVRRRFVREARALAQFHHPHAVAVFDAGQDERYLYLVMELVRGPTLASRLAEDAPFELAEAVRIVNEVLEALAAAHAVGIVHRDVKPGNVLLTVDGDVKLADFGIAKRLDEVAGDLTGTGQFVGTPKYLAPEQMTGLPVTSAVDVYATGVLLFELLAGDPPFDAPTPVATAIAHRDAPVPDVRDRRPDVPDHVADVVARAMAKDPAARFPSADAMRVALAGATTVAAPPVGAGIAPSLIAPTSVMPAAESPLVGQAPRDPSAPHGHGAWWVALAALVTVGAGALLLAARDDPSTDQDRVGRGSATAAPTVMSAAAVATAPSTDAATPPSTTATAPATEPAPAPTTVLATSPPSVPPIVPVSLDDLLVSIENDPDALGHSGPELRDELRKVAELSGRKQFEKAGRVIESIRRWVDDDELDPDVAELAIGILQPLADRAGDKDGKDDRGDRGAD